MPRFTLQPSEFSAGALITSSLLTVAGIFKDCKGSLGGGLLFVVHAGFIMKLVCKI